MNASLWIFGMFGCGIVGGLIGSHFIPDSGAFLGFLGGVFAVACARLRLLRKGIEQQPRPRAPFPPSSN